MHPETGIQGQHYQTKNSELRAQTKQESQPRIKNKEPNATNPRPEIQAQEPQTRTPKPGTQTQKTKVNAYGQKMLGARKADSQMQKKKRVAGIDFGSFLLIGPLALDTWSCPPGLSSPGLRHTSWRDGLHSGQGVATGRPFPSRLCLQAGARNGTTHLFSM